LASLSFLATLQLFETAHRSEKPRRFRLAVDHNLRSTETSWLARSAPISQHLLRVYSNRDFLVQTNPKILSGAGATPSSVCRGSSARHPSPQPGRLCLPPPAPDVSIRPDRPPWQRRVARARDRSFFPGRREPQRSRRPIAFLRTPPGIAERRRSARGLSCSNRSSGS